KRAGRSCRQGTSLDSGDCFVAVPLRSPLLADATLKVASNGLATASIWSKQHACQRKSSRYSPSRHRCVAHANVRKTREVSCVYGVLVMPGRRAWHAVTFAPRRGRQEKRRQACASVADGFRYEGDL